MYIYTYTYMYIYMYMYATRLAQRLGNAEVGNEGDTEEGGRGVASEASAAAVRVMAEIARVQG